MQEWYEPNRSARKDQVKKGWPFWVKDSRVVSCVCVCSVFTLHLDIVRGAAFWNFPIVGVQSAFFVKICAEDS